MTTIRSLATRKSQDASKVQPYFIQQLYEQCYDLFCLSGYKPSGHARAEHQHD
jgi:hypothetical protein